MRVGLDGFPLTSPLTGVGRYTFELARALARLAPSDQFEFLAPASSDNSITELFEQGLPGNLSFSHPRVPRIFRRRWWTLGLPFFLRNTSLDLFHGTNYDVPLWNRVRTVVTIHDLSVLLHPEKHQDKIVQRARRRLPVMARSAGMIITATEAVKAEICQHLGVREEKVAVTPYAPGRDFQPLPPDQTAATRQRLHVADDFLLFVGTLEPRKNLLTLVKAYEHVLLHSSFRPQMVIAGGEGWLMDELFSFIKQSGIGDHLLLTGYLPDEDLRALYSSCRIFIYPSMYEGFGLPPLEAMACGAPVIAGRGSVLQETLGDAACLLDPTDVLGLANKMVELLKDEAQRSQMSLAGKQHAGKFSWEQTARQTLDVYRSVAGSNQ